jgi:hypothetical protein
MKGEQKMISSRKRQLAVALIVACIWDAVPGQEPNEGKMPETKLKFEMSHDLQGYSGISSIKPTHAAQLFINYVTSLPHPSRPDEMKLILETSAGQALSQKQREFLLSSKYAVYGGKHGLPPGYEHFCKVYAVSEDDAKKMAEAVVEFLANRANQIMERHKNYAEELRAEIAEAKKKIPEKEAEAEAAQTALDKVKRKVRYLSVKEAEDAVYEFNRILSTLEVEIAGIRASLEEIGNFQTPAMAKRFTSETSDKVEQMAIQETVKLRAAEAKTETAARLRDEAVTLVRSVERLDNAQRERNRLVTAESSSEDNLAEVEKLLANLKPGMLPPKVYDNKVTIYPVRVDE